MYFSRTIRNFDVQLKRCPDAIDRGTSVALGGQSIFVKADNRNHQPSSRFAAVLVLKCSPLRRDLTKGRADETRETRFKDRRRTKEGGGKRKGENEREINKIQDE